MKTKLSEVAVIRAGHPFRGAIKEDLNGNGYVIQIRDQNDDGNISWSNITLTEVAGRKEPEWLQEGDIAFAARGNKNFSSVVFADDIERLDRPIVCSPHYFQLRIKNPCMLLPEFLAWQLNQPIAQRYFRQSAEGSSQVSIRKSVLEQTPISIPPVQQQRQLVKLAQCAELERQTYQKLIANRRFELEAIAKQILSD